MPDRNMWSPTRIPGTWGRLAPRETLSRGFFGSTTDRGSFSVIASRQRRAFDDHFCAVGKTCATDSAGGRRVGKEDGIDLIHVGRLQHAVQPHVHFHDFIERRAGSLQQLLEVDKNLPSLACRRTAHAFPGPRIDRGEAAHEEKVTAPHHRRHRLAEATRRIGSVHRGHDYFPSGRHRRVLEPSQAAAMTSSSTLKPASICAAHTVRAGGPFATYCR